MLRSGTPPEVQAPHPAGGSGSPAAQCPPARPGRLLADNRPPYGGGRSTLAGPVLPVEPRRALLGAAGSPELSDVVVFLDGRPRSPGTMEWAVTLAQDHGARLTGVFIEPTVRYSQAEAFARGGAIRDVIVAAEERRRREEAAVRARFEGLAWRHAVRWEWRPLSGLLAAELVVHARSADVAVITREDPSLLGHVPAGLVEALALTAGRPVVVLPEQCAPSRVRRALVCWNAGPQAARAVASAMPLLLRAEAVEVLVVDHRGLASAHGQGPGADIAQYLARHGARVEVCRLSSRGEDVGRVILSRAAAFGADLVVMGAFGRSRLSEWVFGGVTRTALAEAALPVLMCH